MALTVRNVGGKVMVSKKTAKIPLLYALVALSVFLVFQVRGSPATPPAMSTADRLLAIEEIHQLKARYIRCLDMKDWVCWEGVFAPTFHFKNGTTEWHGPKEMVESTHGTGIFDRVKTVHHAHMPEIEILSPTTARGSGRLIFSTTFRRMAEKRRETKSFHQAIGTMSMPFTMIPTSKSTADGSFSRRKYTFFRMKWEVWPSRSH